MSYSAKLSKKTNVLDSILLFISRKKPCSAELSMDKSFITLGPGAGCAKSMFSKLMIDRALTSGPELE